MKTLDAKSKKLVNCNRCGEMGLHWEQDVKGWRLFTPEGVIHQCYGGEKNKKSYEKKDKSWKWQKNQG